MPLNPWLEERLKELEKKGVASPQLGIVVEIPVYREQEAIARLKEIAGVRRIAYAAITKTPTRAYIPVTVVNFEAIRQIERIIPYAVISYEMPVWIKTMLPTLKMTDPLLGEIRLSKIEVPRVPYHSLLTSPLAFLAAPFQIKQSGVEIIPTGETVKIMEVPEDNKVKVKVAVIDTGVTPWHPMLRGKKVVGHTTVPEPPLDMQGHGMWCTTCAFGGSVASRFGRLMGVADASEILHVKALTTAGFGMTSGILKAMEIAWREGAKVVSMSLGGTLQGSVEDDPNCKVVRELTGEGVLFVVAAGNEGPDEWTIGSPAAEPSALTVAAYSPKYGDVAVYSSRGPQGEWYKNHPEEYGGHHARYGDNFLKPDLMVPGGGPVEEGQTPIDLIYSGVTGWFDGQYDYAIDGFEAMRGTSMATPAVAGLAALLYDRGLIRSVQDIKRVMAHAEKDVARGYGLMKYTLFKGEG